MQVFLKKLCSFSQHLSCHRHIGKREDPGDEFEAHVFSPVESVLGPLLWDPWSPMNVTISRQKKWFCYLNLAVTLISQFCAAKLAKAKNNATTSCKSTWDTVPYFGINSLSMILCLWSPLHPFSKLLAIQDHAQNLEEQLWMGGRREVSIISHRPVTRSDLKQERLFFRESVSKFCNWLSESFILL